MKPKKILWVDDSFANKLHDLMAYEDELTYSGGYDDVKIAHPDEAVDFLEKKDEDFACIILDMMMPFGKRFSRGETEDGTKTGIILANKIQKMDKYEAVPIVLLTSVRHICESHDKKKFLCLFKADIAPFRFLREIQNEIKKHVGGNRE